MYRHTFHTFHTFPNSSNIPHLISNYSMQRHFELTEAGNFNLLLIYSRIEMGGTNKKVSGITNSM